MGVKEMQRNDSDAKEQWWAYCDSQGNGIRDPSKHTSMFVQTFINMYTSGNRWQGSDHPELAELFKEGQRKSKAWKECWAEYCQQSGSRKNDPASHDARFLVGFLDFLGQS